MTTGLQLITRNLIGRRYIPLDFKDVELEGIDLVHHADDGVVEGARQLGRQTDLLLSQGGSDGGQSEGERGQRRCFRRFPRLRQEELKKPVCGVSDKSCISP